MKSNKQLHVLSTAETKERGFRRGFRSQEREGGGHGCRRHPPSQIQRQTTDCQGRSEDQKWLQHTLDDRLLLRALGCGKETGRSQKGALGRHDQGVRHYLQEDLLDKQSKAVEQSGTDVTGAVRCQGGGEELISWQDTPHSPNIHRSNMLQREEGLGGGTSSENTGLFENREKHEKEMFWKTLCGSSFAVVQQLRCMIFTPTVP